MKEFYFRFTQSLQIFPAERPLSLNFRDQIRLLYEHEAVDWFFLMKNRLENEAELHTSTMNQIEPDATGKENPVLLANKVKGRA